MAPDGILDGACCKYGRGCVRDIDLCGVIYKKSANGCLCYYERDLNTSAFRRVAKPCGSLEALFKSPAKHGVSCFDQINGFVLYERVSNIVVLDCVALERNWLEVKQLKRKYCNCS